MCLALKCRINTLSLGGSSIAPNHAHLTITGSLTLAKQILKKTTFLKKNENILILIYDNKLIKVTRIAMCVCVYIYIAFFVPCAWCITTIWRIDQKEEFSQCVTTLRSLFTMNPPFSIPVFLFHLLSFLLCMFNVSALPEWHPDTFISVCLFLPFFLHNCSRLIV